LSVSPAHACYPPRVTPDTFLTGARPPSPGSGRGPLRHVCVSPRYAWTPHLRCRGPPPHVVHGRSPQVNIVPRCRPVPPHARHRRCGCRM